MSRACGGGEGTLNVAALVLRLAPSAKRGQNQRLGVGEGGEGIPRWVVPIRTDTTL